MHFGNQKLGIFERTDERAKDNIIVENARCWEVEDRRAERGQSREKQVFPGRSTRADGRRIREDEMPTHRRAKRSNRYRRETDSLKVKRYEFSTDRERSRSGLSYKSGRKEGRVHQQVHRKSLQIIQEKP